MFDTISTNQQSSAGVGSVQTPFTAAGQGAGSFGVAVNTGGSGDRATAGQEQKVGGKNGYQSVYTMPNQYLPKSLKGSGSGSNFPWKWALFIAGMAMVVIGVAAAVIIVVLQQSQQEAQQRAAQQNTNAAANANANTNTNTANANGGTPLNTNVNPNTNASVTNGLFPNDNTNGTGQNANSTAGVLPFVSRTVVPLSEDKDRDQLTDAEEVLYGTKVQLPDSDGDGFVDGTEVLQGYSPLTAQKTLAQDGLTLQYQNTAHGWNMTYPSKWVAGSTDDAQRTVLFTSDAVEGEFVQVTMVDNPSGLPAKQWYTNIFTDADPSAIQETTIAGLAGIVSPDGYTYYLADDNYIIGITYNFGTKASVSFKTTFDMMRSSFQYDPTAAKPRNTNTTNSTTNVQPSNANNTAPTNTTNTNNSNANSNVNTTSTNGRNTNLTNTNSSSNTNQVRTIQIR